MRARPLRLAFLVPEGEDCHEILDEIFADCYRRWGGRYNLVIPCTGGVVRYAYRPWLEAYDADLIYSYVDLDPDEVLRIHRSCAPSMLEWHGNRAPRERTHRWYKPHLLIDGLTSLSVALPYAQSYPRPESGPMMIVEYADDTDYARFLGDNFGRLEDSFGVWSLPAPLEPVLEMLTVFTPAMAERYRMARRPAPNRAAHVPQMLKMLAAKRQAYGVAHLAADLAPRIDLHDHLSGFSIFVGSTVGDRVAYWNERSLAPIHQGREPWSLMISPGDLENQDLFDALVIFVQHRNHIQRGGSGPPHVTLRSLSLSSAQLEPLRDRFRAAAQSWNVYTVATIDSIDAVVPTVDRLEKVSSLVSPIALQWQIRTKDFDASGDTARPPQMLPDHLHNVPLNPAATTGLWAIDVALQRQNNLTRYANIRHWWRLPRRLRMHGAFFLHARATGPSQGIRPPRANSFGELVLYTGINEEPIPFDLPADETVFQYSLTHGHDWLPFKPLPLQPSTSGPYVAVRPSDKGRLLMATLRMFGGLNEAGAVLNHKFWSEIFERLGTKAGEERLAEVQATLKKRFKNEVVNTSEEWERLGNFVIAESQRTRLPDSVISFADLAKAHEPYLLAEKKRLDDSGHHPPDIIADYIERDRGSLRHSVQRLCRLKVLHQGYEWRCPHCFHGNWQDIAALTSELTCVVCGELTAVPVDRPWDFRLNGFLQAGLHHQGIAALIWCLVHLERRAHKSFFFLPSTELYQGFPEDGIRPEREADLIVVVDGLVRLCEVKASDRRVDIDAIVQMALRIQPDIVTLATLSKSAPKMHQCVVELRKRFANTGIEVELITPIPPDISDDAELP